MSEHRPAPRLAAACDALAPLPGVTDARLASVDTPAEPAIEVTVGPGYERVPPRVLRLLVERDCGIVTVTRQGDYRIVVAR